jgi:hypothetical protein
MIAVEFVNLVTAHQRGAHDALFDESRKAAADPDFGAADGLLGDLTDGEWLAGRSEHCQHRAVQRCRHRTCRIR